VEEFTKSLKRLFPGCRCGHLFRSFLTEDEGEGDGEAMFGFYSTG